MSFGVIFTFIRHCVLVTETTLIKTEALAPNFTTQLVACEVLIGYQVVLECTVVGIPEPEITWYQVGEHDIIRQNYCDAVQHKKFNFFQIV